MVQTYADILLAEGEKKGEQKGRVEGRVEGARRMIVLHGAKRLGSPDSAIEAKLNAVADFDRLERMMGRLIDDTASSWSELLSTS